MIMSSSVEQAKEGVTSFNCYTHYYSSVFMLRLKLSLDGRELAVEEQAVGTREPFIQLRDVRLDLDSLAFEMEQVLRSYGVRRVLRARHDGRFPIYEVLFTSQHTVEKFLLSKEEAEAKVEEHLSSIISAPSSSLCLQFSCQLYLVIPHKGAKETYLMTFGNYKQLLPKFLDNFLFKLEAKSFTDCAAVQVEFHELVRELDDVVEWFLLGIYLGVPEKNLKEIEEDYSKSSRRKAEVLYKWSKLCQTSWQSVVDALVGIAEIGVARKVAKKFGLTVPDKVPEPPMLSKMGIKQEVSELRAQIAEKNEQLSDKSFIIKQQQKIAKEAKRVVGCLRNRLEVVSEEMKKLRETQSQKEKALREKETELQLLKDMVKKLDRGETNKDLDEAICRKETETCKLREEVASSKTKLEGKVAETENLRSKLLLQSKELRENSTKMRLLEKERAHLLDINRSLRASMDLQLQQQMTSYRTNNKLLKSRLATECKSEAKAMETYQQILKEKQDKIATLLGKLKDQEAEIQRLKEQIKCNTHTTVSLCELVMEVVDLRNSLEKAEDEEWVASRHVVLAEKEITNLREQFMRVSLEADPTKCVAEGPGIRAAEVNCTTTFSVRVKDQNSRPCTSLHILDVEVKCQADGSIIETKQICIAEGTHEIQYTSAKRGRHQVSVAVNGVQIPGSPFALCVRTPPTALCKPVQVIEGLNFPMGIATNRDSEIIVSVLELERCGVYVLTRGGGKKRWFGTKGKACPCGVAVDKDGSIFVADVDKHRVQKFAKDGQLLKSLSSGLCGPRGLELNDTNNKLYVCDTGNHRIQVFDSELNFCTLFGRQGSGPGQFNQPWDISFDSSTSLSYVSDNGNDRIQVLDQDGAYIREFSQKGSTSISCPYYIHVDGDLVYVSEPESNCVSVFTTGGVFVCSIGAMGSRIGELVGPTGVTVDRDGFVYICDHYNNRIQKF